jgi:arginyl-tRNA--protein-N-Asp/Glu arginylyltransferase
MYLHWDQQTITDFSPEHMTAMYNHGYVCTRPEEGLMQQTRSVRVDLSKFELSSENRRILKKTEAVHMMHHALPYTQYSWEIGKMGKEFYETKFGDGTFSANKVKELLTSERRDFNTLLIYSSPYEGESEGVTKNHVQHDEANPSEPHRIGEEHAALGYAICVETPELLHYSYPFYDLESAPKDIGMGMMVRAVQYAKETGKKYCYLGSAQRPGDTYKFQFTGMEWYDGNVWQTEVDTLKQLLTLSS